MTLYDFYTQLIHGKDESTSWFDHVYDNLKRNTNYRYLGLFLIILSLVLYVIQM